MSMNGRGFCVSVPSLNCVGRRVNSGKSALEKASYPGKSNSKKIAQCMFGVVCIGSIKTESNSSKCLDSGRSGLLVEDEELTSMYGNEFC
jgi:hypothetical protein